MKNLLVSIPNMEDATSLYRGSGPLADLRRRMDINLVFMDKTGENGLDFADAVFIQRPAGANHLQLAQWCKQNRIPLWIDYDDLLFDIPRDNPAYEGYMNKEVRESIVKIIQAADLVTVSTTQLKRCIQQLNKQVHVVPNALPDKYLHLAKPYQHKKHINWRGTNTHQKDLAEYGAEMMEIMAEHKDATMTFIGFNPWYITDNIKTQQCVVVQPMSVGEYFRFMSATNPSIQMVPLHSSMFNLCKSNIAWLESSLAGAVCIGPQWPEWIHPGVLTYGSTEDFKACLEFALNSPKEMKEQHEQGWEHIKQNFLLSKVNQKRVDLVTALYGYEPYPDGGAPLPDDTLMELE